MLFKESFPSVLYFYANSGEKQTNSILNLPFGGARDWVSLCEVIEILII